MIGFFDWFFDYLSFATKSQLKIKSTINLNSYLNVSKQLKYVSKFDMGLILFKNVKQRQLINRSYEFASTAAWQCPSKHLEDHSNNQIRHNGSLRLVRKTLELPQSTRANVSRSRSLRKISSRHHESLWSVK